MRQSRLLLCFLPLLPLAVAQADELPDLEVVDIALAPDCRPLVTVRNLGPGVVPAYAYDPLAGASLQIDKGPDPWQSDAGTRLSSFDSARGLSAAGGQVQRTLGNVVIGTATLRLRVDPAGLINEGDKTNNVAERTVTCSMPHPDLGLAALEFDESCRPRLQLANFGQGDAPSNTYSGLNPYLQRRIDDKPGMQLYLSSADPQRQLLAGGGQLGFTDTLPFAATASLRYQLMRAPAGNDPANDAVEVAVPERCGGPPPGVAPTDAQTGSATAKPATPTRTLPARELRPELRKPPTRKDDPPAKD